MFIYLKSKTLVTSLASLLLMAFLAVGADDRPAGFDPFGAAEANMPASPENVSDSGPVIPQVEFNNNDISMAFQIISDAAGWSIFPTADVSRAKISLWAKNVTAGELLDTVVTLTGFIYHRDRNVITVMTYDEYMQYHGLAKKVITFKYADAASVAAVVKPFLTRLGKNVVHKETNTIVLYEADANLEFIASIIKRLDIPAEGIVVEVINLKYADCETLAKILQNVFSGQKKDTKNKSPEPIAQAAQSSKPAETGDANDVLVPYEQTEIYAVSHANQLVVVGTKLNIQKVKEVVSMIDVYGENTVFEVIDLKYVDAEVVSETLREMFDSKDSKGSSGSIQKVAQPSDSSKQQAVESKSEVEGLLSTPQSHVVVHAIGRTNQLIIKAFRGDVEKLKKLVEKLDVFVEPTTKNYHFTYVDAAEISKGLERILDVYGRYGRDRGRGGEQSIGGRDSGITLVEKTNSILLTGPPSVHRIMTSIVESVDVPGTYEAGMIRIYKLENADVEEVAKTIAELIQSESKEKEKSAEVKFTEKPAKADTGVPGSKEMAKMEEFVPQVEARVSVSKSTNSIVVQATAREHRELEKLIKELDKRRRQVLIEAKIVELTNTDDFSLGVELSHAVDDVIAFSAFGLSTNLNPASGTRNIIVSPGGTAAVLRPDKVQAILQALKSVGNARIISAPRILVNDNAIGFINSIAEEPTMQTNLGQTTTTTSFAGFVEAGTQFAITPHISENRYLRVEYQITLNSFGTKPTDPTIPPPRNTSSIRSEATVPGGFTIVVGGLQMTDQSENVDKVPLLGDIPLVGLAFKNTLKKKQYKTTYLFITPVIMESEDFSDLKDISRKAVLDVETNKDDQNASETKIKGGD